MKTFSVRDLDRHPGRVLAAADRDGIARVRSRTGRSYAVRPEPSPTTAPDWAGFAERRRAALARSEQRVIGPRLAAKLDRLIAGE
ncbi:MAG: hypothetical protein KAX37_04150 [Opitutaceae bacterium]|nr:hypothetical protein [Opitutaceae bacterium]